jgi:hypothetical protein
MRYLVEPLYANSYSYPGINPNKRYVISVMHSGLVAAVRNGQVQVEQRKWTEAPEQQWRLEYVPGSSTYFRIVSVASGQVADVWGGGTANGVGIGIYPWSGGQNEQFLLEYLGTSTFRIKSRHSNKVWDIPGLTTEPGTQIIQWDWNGGDNQKWRINEVLDIVNAPSYKDKVSLFQHANYQGIRKDFGLGSYDLAEMGLGNQLSSLKIPSGVRVTLFKNRNFTGPAKAFTSDAAYVGDDFNDRTVAILIDLVATVYEHDNYGGRSQPLGLGNYDVGALAFGNDKISSIKVPVGMQVVLFQDSKFRGATKVAMTDVPSLIGFNDKTSSIQVKMIGTVVPHQAVTFGDRIFLKSDHGTLLTANAAGSIRNDTLAVTDDAWFTVVRAGPTVNMHYLCYGDVIALRTSSGKYVTDSNGSVVATVTELNAWEKFVVVRSGESESRTFVAEYDMISLRTWRNNYVRAVNNGTVDAAATAIGPWEKYRIGERQPTAHAQGTISCSADARALHLAAEPMAAACGADVCPVDACGADQTLLSVCGADACVVANCGAAASMVTVCGAAAAIVSICGLDVSGVTGCVVQGCGAEACGANLCGAEGCAAAACGADACGADACGAAGCGAAGCGAAGCGANGCGANGCAAAGCGAAGCAAMGCPVAVCTADGCGAQGCGAAAGCFALACGANVCAIDLCKIDACGADACAIDLIPLIPGI